MNQNDEYTEIISGNIRREIATEKKLLSTVTNNTLTHTIISETTSIQQTQHHTLSTQNTQSEKEKEKERKEKTFQKKENSNSNLILKNANFSPQNSALNSISIDLVGHLNGEVNIGHLRTGKVRFLSDLNSREYYEAISRVSICLFLSYYFSFLHFFT